VLLIIGGLILLVTITGDNDIRGYFWGLALLGLGAWLYRKAHSVYRLFLMTSSNEVQAYESRDFGEITELRDAVEAAMMGR